jgi:hypothetical protein
MGQYNVDIVPDERLYSQAFKDFVHYHFLTTHFREQDELDTYFYEVLVGTELETARRLIRQNLHLRETGLFKGAGLLADVEALPVLYKMLNENRTNLSRALTIGQAIWRINGDQVYETLLLELQYYPSDTMKQAHVKQVKDLRSLTSINILFSWLEGGDFTSSLACDELWHILHGRPKKINEYGDIMQFIRRKDDMDFKVELVERLKQLKF